MEVLQRGTRSIQVPLLQRLLNKAARSSIVKEDGIFGHATATAVTNFQKQQRIPHNGIVDPTTWERLGIKHDITQNVWLVPQSTTMTCWSAAATMVLGSNRSVGPAGASLSAGGGLLPNPTNVQTFANALGLRMFYPQSWAVQGLVDLLRRGPAWATGGIPGGQAGQMALHAIVLSALWSDGDGDGSGTMIRIHDPWQRISPGHWRSTPGQGSVYASFYSGTVDGFSFMSIYILQR
jgi:Putative peptidoglycan binding domain/Papain-like cysteine protease AvrRpt2